MKKTWISVALITSVFMGSPLLAQKKSGSGDYDRKKEIVYDGKRYRYYNNYLTLGAGYGHNSYTKNLQFNLGGDFNFHIMTQYFQLGGFLGGNYFGNYNNYQGHLAYGKRFEQNKFNLAGYLGVSYSGMNRSFVDDSLGVIYRFIQKPGFHACVQATYKYKYDLGIGLAVFADINSAQSIYGVRAEFYFSGAYRGERVKKKIENPEGGNN